MRYWLSCITGMFWDWKTFSESLKMYETKDSEVYVISNVPYSRCNYFFSTEEDLVQLFYVLDSFCEETNKNIEEYAKNRVNYKDIYIIIDEAHRYFDSRSSLWRWNNLEKIKNVLTQCRKRNIRIVAISQKARLIDLRLRTLSDYVEEYKKGSFFGFYWVRHSVYENRWDIWDFEVDNTVRIQSDWNAISLKEDAKIYSEFFKPLTFGLQLFCAFDKARRRIKKEYYNTYYICWLPDSRVKPLTLEDLQQGLLKSNYDHVKESVNKDSLLRKTWFKFVNIFNKILIKIKNFSHLGSKGSSVQEFKYPLSFNSKDYQVKKDLFVDNKNV